MSDRLNQGIDFWNNRPAAPFPGTEPINEVLENWGNDSDDYSSVPVSGGVSQGVADLDWGEGGGGAFVSPRIPSLTGSVVEVPEVEPGMSASNLARDSDKQLSLVIDENGFTRIGDAPANEAPRSEISPNFERDNSAIYEEYFRSKLGLPNEVNERGNVMVDGNEVVPAYLPTQYTPMGMLHRTPMDRRDDIGKLAFETVDDGSSLDFQHVASPRATGSVMQDYGELGMGGRGWWEYSPYEIYTKDEEQSDFGFTPYTPPQRNGDIDVGGSWLLNGLSKAFGDVAGLVGKSREHMTDYGINYDKDKNPETDNSIRINGSDWDYRAKSYMDNMDKIIRSSPGTLLSMPENGELHGAPVTTMVREYEIPDANGNMHYTYGDVITDTDDEGNEYVATANDDGTLNVRFSDGQSIDVSRDWFRSNNDGRGGIPDGRYVPLDEARGPVPEDLDSLNQWAIDNGRLSPKSISAPVQYIPDLVMEDGTRLTYNQARDIYNDTDPGSDFSKQDENGVSYDMNLLSMPSRLVGDIVEFDDDGKPTFNLRGLPASAWDLTAGSAPLFIDKVAWPISIAQSLKSSAGIDSNKFNPLTNSDQYIAATLDENTGEFKPTYTESDRLSNALGTALVPLTEELAGPLSGHSLVEKIPALSKFSGKLGDLPKTAGIGRLLGTAGLGAVGEGAEELVGNVFDELSSQGGSAFGNPVTPDGERLLDDNGDPVRDENGNYKFVDANGEPIRLMSDETGHVYKDSNTPFQKRLQNYIDPSDLLNAFMGGALVDTVMQGPGVVFRAPGAIRNSMGRRDAGVREYEAPVRRDWTSISPESVFVNSVDGSGAIVDNDYVEEE